MACFSNRHAACLTLSKWHHADRDRVGSCLINVWAVEYIAKGEIMNRLKTLYLGTFDGGSVIISGVTALAQELRQDRRELTNDRAENRDDKKERLHDRQEVNRHLRQGASAA